MISPRPDRPKIRKSFAAASTIAAAVALGALGGARSQVAQAPRARSDAERIKGLEDELTNLAKRYENLSHDVNDLANFSPPIGSTIAYPGKWPDKGPARDAFEAKMGWMLCDGRAIPLNGDDAEKYAALAAAFKQLDGTYLYGGSGSDDRLHLPDYQGYFLRGVDRPGTGRDRDGARAVGSVQQDTTKRPVTQNFITADSGDHVHRAVWEFAEDDGREDRQPLRNLVKRAGLPAIYNAPPGVGIMRTSGAHAHSVTSGGDPETRPINVAVHWLIKFR